jgi:DNA topoisomerase-2
MRKIRQVSQLTNVRNRSMWTGSKKRNRIKMYLINADSTAMEHREISITPALMTIVNEVVNNAADHHINFPAVKNIWIDFDDAGQVTVTNDGPGFYIEDVQTIDGRTISSVQMACSEFQAGDNLDEKEDDKRIVGGQNGLGIKLTAAHSTELTIYTVDTVSQQAYEQRFTDRLDTIHPPKITKIPKSDPLRKGGTRISFMPAYAKLDYKTSDNSDIRHWMHTRAYQIAAYLEQCTVHFNGKAIDLGRPGHQFTTYANLFVPDVWSGIMKNDSHPLHVCIGTSDKARSVSLINAIDVHQGGTHVKHVQASVVAALEPRVKKLIKKSGAKFSKTMITNSMFIFVRAAVAGPEFSSQTKERLTTPASVFTHTFTKANYDAIWALLEPHITSAFLGKVGDSKVRVKRALGHIDKHTPAARAGSKPHSSKCILLLAEGDSALGLIHSGIVHPKSKLSYDTCGTYSLQGVGMNALKETTVYKDKDGSKRLVRSKRLQDNNTIQNIVAILGLDYTRDYTTDADLKTLRYGRAIICTDADVDGRGQIAGLVMVFFWRFWPALIECGFLCRFDTPVVRAYPTSNHKYVEEFFREEDFNAWKERHGTKGYKVRYIKGLGGHEKADIGPMFRRFDEMVVTYALDDAATANAMAFYGPKTALRKAQLATPITTQPSGRGVVTVSEQLTMDTKAFQKDNIMRKLPQLGDGKVPSQRKLLFYARNHMGNDEMKTSVMTANASGATAYKHGEASLSATASRQAQNHPTMRNLPTFIACGQFGTRKSGGKDFANPRYTHLKLNSRLIMQLYPPEDDCLLDYCWADKMRIEPVTYMPIIPSVVLENESLPATGWKLRLWARNVTQVFANVRDLITGKIDKARPMDFWATGFTGEIRKVEHKEGDKLYSIGAYSFSSKTHKLIITEVPASFNSAMYSEAGGKYSLVGREEVVSVIDNTNDDEVRIEVQLDKELFPRIKETHGDANFDPIEHWAGLYERMDDQINLMVGDQVVEFDSYEKVVDAWFPLRKAMYEQRITRQIILCRLRIKYLTNVIRFSDEHSSYKIGPAMSREQIDTVLEENEYVKFNHTLLTSPKFTPTKDLERLILDGKYDYLVDMRYRDLLKAACDTRKVKLKEENALLKRLRADDGSDGLFAGSKTWLAELDVLEETITKGISTMWTYGEKPPRYR